MSGTSIVYDIVARDRASGTFNAVAKAAQRNAEAMAKLGRNMQALGRDMSRHITLPVVAASAASVKMAVDFSNAMTKIQTQAGGSAQDVKSLSGQVLKLKDAQQGPVQLAQAMYHLKSVGLDNAAAMKALKAASDLAAVGGSNLEETTNALAGAWRTGIKGAQDFQQASATLNAVVGAGNMRMEDLVKSLGTGVLPAAKTFGLSLRDVGSALAVMTDESVPADVAATRLRMTFSLLGAPSQAAIKALQTIGLTSTSLASDMRQPNGLITAVGDLKKHLKDSGLTAEQQAAVISKAFGGGQSGSAIMSLVNNFDVLKQKQDQVTRSLGKYQDAVKAQAETPGAQFKELTANLQRDAILFGDQILPLAVKAVEFFTQIADKVSSWTAGQKQVAIEAGLVAAAIGPIVGIVGKVTEAIGLARKAMVTFGIVSAASQGAVALAFGGIGLAIGAAVYGLAKWQEHQANIKASAQSFDDAIDTMTGKINAQTVALNKNVQAKAISQLSDAGAYEQARQLGIRFNDVTQAALGNAEAQKRVSAVLDHVGSQQASATLHAAGYTQGLDKNGQAAKKLADTLGIVNSGLQSSISKQRDMKTATKQAAQADKEASGSQQTWAQMVKAANGVIDQQNQALAQSIDNMFKAAQAAIELSGNQIGVKQAYSDAEKALKKNGATLDLNTQKGRDNRTALNNLATSQLTYIHNLEQNGASTKKVTGVTEDARKQFIKVAEQMGKTKDQAKHLADQYGLIPDNVTTAIKETGAQFVLNQINEIQKKIKDTQGKTVTVRYNVLTGDATSSYSGSTNVAHAGTGSGGVYHATGGPIVGPGTGTSDSVPIMASNGEYVLKASAVSKLGLGRLDFMNRTGMLPGFASGGYLNIQNVLSGGGYGAFSRAMSNAEASILRNAKKAIPSFPGLSGGTSGSNQKLGLAMMLAAGWGSSQWPALKALWTRESGWNANAVNPSSGAYGIPQALGHGHPFNLGDAAAQIAWGLSYIRSRYGSPNAAWAHETAAGWYRHGGIVRGQGTGTSDSVPAWLSVGEAVIPADVVQHFANGGLISGKTARHLSATDHIFANAANWIKTSLIKYLTAGSTDKINTGFSTLRTNIGHLFTEVAKNAKSDAIDRYTKQIAKYRAEEKKANTTKKEKLALEKKIAEAEKNLTAARKLNTDKAALAAQKSLIASLSGEESALKSVTNARIRLANQIQSAEDKLKQAKDTRNQYASTVRGNLNSYGSIVGTGATSGAMKNTLTLRLSALRRFSANLKQLAKDGIDPITYQQIVDAGIDGGGLQTSDALIHGGTGALKQIKRLEGQIHSVSGAIGTATSHHLYQGGVNAAQRVLNGLNARDNDLEKVGDKIGKAIVTELRESLGLKHGKPEATAKDLIRELMKMEWTIDDKSLRLRVRQELGSGLKKASTHV